MLTRFMLLIPSTEGHIGLHYFHPQIYTELLADKHSSTQKTKLYNIYICLQIDQSEFGNITEIPYMVYIYKQAK